MKSRKETPFQALSYGIPVLLIARWRHVTEAVALNYKTGRRSPSAAATALFTLNLNGRVVPDAWHGYHFEGAKLWDPWDKQLTVNVYRGRPANDFSADLKVHSNRIGF